jgi:hypothetical protein
VQSRNKIADFGDIPGSAALGNGGGTEPGGTKDGGTADIGNPGGIPGWTCIGTPGRGGTAAYPGTVGAPGNVAYG